MPALDSGHNPSLAYNLFHAFIIPKKRRRGRSQRNVLHLSCCLPCQTQIWRKSVRGYEVLR
ncbi:hypothetical protein SAY87_007842 [Trapa incisa]|uniref:Uncharacterized protein n=1 Tax=Trapa incisa TaxID=236973 RepID=A0AAN7KFT3_9MYRT|nr:hypothetical protein SAY87_007842 [Trapa incisa]